jgi:hypothetical protein
VKFHIPPLPAGQDPSQFTYRVRIYGGKVETNGADQIFFYPASNDWDPATVRWASRPACNYRSDAVLYLNHSREYRMVNVDKAVRKALAEGKPKSRGISAVTARGIITSSNRRLHQKAWF